MLRLLEANGFDAADEERFIAGSALLAVEGDNSDIGREAIRRLMDAVDKFIEEPVRDTALDFLMPVEDVFTITGRGTVATGRIERGVINSGDEVDIIGLRETQSLPLQVSKCSVRFLIVVKQVIMLVFFFVVSSVKTSSVVRLSVSQVLLLHTPSSSAKPLSLSEEEGGRKKGFKTGYRPQFYFRTTDVTGTITLSDEKKDGSSWIPTLIWKLTLIKPIAIEEESQVCDS